MFGQNDIRHLLRAQAHGAAIPDDNTEYIDQRIQRIGMEEMVISRWLIDNDLTIDLPDWWDYEFYARAKTGEAGEARHAMNPEGNREDLWQLGFDGDQVPLISTYDQVHTDGRRQAISRRTSGYNLEEAHVDQAILNCNRATENLCIYGLRDKNGNAGKYMGVGVKGILNTTNTFSYSDMTGLTPVQIKDLIAAQLQVLINNRYYERVGVFFPTNYAGMLTKDYAAGYPGKLKQNLIELEAGNAQLDIMVAPRLPAHRVVIIAKTTRTIQLIIGQEPRAISVPSHFGYNADHLVVACAIPFLQSDPAGNYGVIVGNVA